MLNTTTPVRPTTRSGVPERAGKNVDVIENVDIGAGIAARASDARKAGKVQHRWNVRLMNGARTAPRSLYDQGAPAGRVQRGRLCTVREDRRGHAEHAAADHHHEGEPCVGTEEAGRLQDLRAHGLA
jgi:hypothetical protein